MNMKHIFLIVACLMIFSPAFTLAARFESLSEGMVDALTDDQESVKRVNLKIEFDVNADTIRQESLAILNELCKALGHPQLANQIILIIGHTDSDGSEAYNLDLSARRAWSVKTFLMDSCRIVEARLKVEGRGEGQPLVPNTSPANKQQNRRVEIQVEPQKQDLSDPFNEKQGVGFQSLDDF